MPLTCYDPARLRGCCAVACRRCPDSARPDRPSSRAGPNTGRSGPPGTPSERSCRPPPPRCASRSQPRSAIPATPGRSVAAVELDGCGRRGRDRGRPPVAVDLMLERVPEGIVVRGTVTADVERGVQPLPRAGRRRDLRARRRAVRAAAPRGRDLQARRRRDRPRAAWSATRCCSSCPLAPLCDPTARACARPAASNRNLTRCECVTTEIDPRWAALAVARAVI